MHDDVLEEPSQHYTCRIGDGSFHENLFHRVDHHQNYMHSYDKRLQSNR